MHAVGHRPRGRRLIKRAARATGTMPLTQPPAAGETMKHPLTVIASTTTTHATAGRGAPAPVRRARGAAACVGTAIRVAW